MSSRVLLRLYGMASAINPGRGSGVLRATAAGLFLASSEFPRSRETRSPLVEDLARHREELAEKYRYLADAPRGDDHGNPVAVHFSRKQREHYLMGMKDGKASGWTAHFVDGRWQASEDGHGAAAPAAARRGSGRSRGRKRQKA